jgi:hypothetical protein
MLKVNSLNSLKSFINFGVMNELAESTSTVDWNMRVGLPLKQRRPVSSQSSERSAFAEQTRGISRLFSLPT